MPHHLQRAAPDPALYGHKPGLAAVLNNLMPIVQLQMDHIEGCIQILRVSVFSFNEKLFYKARPAYLFSAELKTASEV
jgi:hypothetical protein